MPPSPLGWIPPASGASTLTLRARGTLPGGWLVPGNARIGNARTGNARTGNAETPGRLAEMSGRNVGGGLPGQALLGEARPVASPVIPRGLFFPSVDCAGQSAAKPLAVRAVRDSRRCASLVVGRRPQRFCRERSGHGDQAHGEIVNHRFSPQRDDVLTQSRFVHSGWKHPQFQ